MMLHKMYWMMNRKEKIMSETEREIGHDINSEINVMLDLETLGTRAGCGILSIGATTFDEKKQIHIKIPVSSSLAFGLHEEGKTLNWWYKQDPAIREDAFSGTTQLDNALVIFYNWVQALGDSKDIYIWGNGADFDLPILGHAYSALFMEKPWAPFNGRCYRTLKSLLPHVKPGIKNAARHNALEDALYQARHARKLLEMI